MRSERLRLVVATIAAGAVVAAWQSNPGTTSRSAIAEQPPQRPPNQAADKSTGRAAQPAKSGDDSRAAETPIGARWRPSRWGDDDGRRPVTVSQRDGKTDLYLSDVPEAAQAEPSNKTGWPCWRGPKGDNQSDDSWPAVRWSENDNVVWKSLIPGRGHATPCIWEDRIFIATADEQEQVQMLVCYDRRTGKQLWRSDVHRGQFLPKNEKNSHASATPACDGERIYVPFMNEGALWLTAADLAGKTVWRQRVGAYSHANGYASSPVLFERFVIVASDNKADACLAAYDRTSGELAWRVARKPSDNSGTPIVGRVAGRPQLLLHGAWSVASFDPASGKELWHVEHPTEVAACTMAFDGDLVFASGNVPEKETLCVRADGTGDVTATHVVWRTAQQVTYVPSPLAHAGRLYVITDSGVARCLEATTGRELWKKRLPGTFSASPLLVGDNIYATCESGATFVFEAADRFALVARNELDEECLASPVFCDGRFYLRTATHLYCIGGVRRSSQEPALE
ncbi:MAG TPA: PQQ-binding-like beta-propeller repeat protein [Pirellulales bacterium]|nr:PQQ-binding-like beta-propeller repeat protein [Pirellulales bacterium]